MQMRSLVHSFRRFHKVCLTTGGVAQRTLQGRKAIARQFEVELQAMVGKRLGALARAALRDQLMHATDVFEAAGDCYLYEVDNWRLHCAAQTFGCGPTVCAYESAGAELPYDFVIANRLSGFECHRSL